MAYNESTNGSGAAVATGNRDNGGKFLPGHSLGGPGRPTRAVEKQYLDAIREGLPPDQVQALIVEALELARSTRSWRGLLEIAQFAVSYAAGKPAQKIVTQDSNLDALLAALRDDTGPLLPPAQP